MQRDAPAAETLAGGEEALAGVAAELERLVLVAQRVPERVEVGVVGTKYVMGEPVRRGSDVSRGRDDPGL